MRSKIESRYICTGRQDDPNNSRMGGDVHFVRMVKRRLSFDKSEAGCRGFADSPGGD